MSTAFRFALPPTLSSLRNYVDGEFVGTDRHFDNVSPLHGKVLGQVHEADAALVDRAVKAARRALDGPWGSASVDERAQLLYRVADVIERRFDELGAGDDAGECVVITRGDRIELMIVTAGTGDGQAQQAARDGIDAFIPFVGDDDRDHFLRELGFLVIDR